MSQSTIDELKAISSAAHVWKKTSGEYIKLGDEEWATATLKNMVLQLPFNILKQINVSQI